MEDGEDRDRFVVKTLERFKDFADHIVPVIGRQGRKYIHNLANRGLSVQTNNPEYLQIIALEILKRVKESEYLARALVVLGDYVVVFHIFFASLLHETQGKKSFWKFRQPLVFRDEEKECLIKFLLSEEHKLRVFLDIRQLLRLAKAIPYECQKKLYVEYMRLQSKVADASDLLDVYEMWSDLSPDLRGSLRQFIKSGLSVFRFGVWKEKKTGDIQVVENTNGESSPKSDKN